MTKGTKKKPNEINFKMFSIICLLIIAGLIFIPGILLLLLIGMLPTFSAIITDQSKSRTQSFCVGACNLAGLTPVFYTLAKQRFSIQASDAIIHDFNALLIILLSAAVGWGIAIIVPGLTLSYYKAKDRSTLIQLSHRYTVLVESWGDAIPKSDIMEIIQNGGIEKFEHSKTTSNLETQLEQSALPHKQS